MPAKIDQKISGIKVVTGKEEALEAMKFVTSPDTSTVKLPLTENLLKRPKVLLGATYKIASSPNSPNCAVYVTINDCILHEGTPEEKIVPYEIFINSKDILHLQWVTALTRVISAVFRKGGDVTFLVEELISIHDPKGGYLFKGGYYASLVAEIGYVLKTHFEKLQLIHSNTSLAEAAKKMIADKTEPGIPGIPKGTLCPKCFSMSVVVMDGCATCLECGDSKCG